MQVAKISKPKIIQEFENLLWANSPEKWVLKSTYFQGTLYVSMLVHTSDGQVYHKIRRSFDIKNINSRSEDLWGLAIDCIDEMKTEIKNQL